MQSTYVASLGSVVATRFCVAIKLERRLAGLLRQIFLHDQRNEDRGVHSRVEGNDIARQDEEIDAVRGIEREGGMRGWWGGG